MIENSSEDWFEKYGKLSAYYKQHGHSSPDARDPLIGSWCSFQRQQYKNKYLSQDKIKLLEQIEFVWDPYKEDWEKQINSLKRFIEINGHSNPVATGSGGSSLGIWCSRQRVFFKNNELSKERIDLLNTLRSLDIGFVISISFFP